MRALETAHGLALQFRCQTDMGIIPHKWRNVKGNPGGFFVLGYFMGLQGTGGWEGWAGLGGAGEDADNCGISGIK